MPKRNFAARLIPGLTPSTLKHHPALAPLLAAIGVGALGAGAYLLRLAIKNPDVCWDKANFPYPWQKLKQSDRYKFYVTDKKLYENRTFPPERPDI